MSYMTRAFNLSKDFEYKWTVNFKFIEESLFLNKRFGHVLICILLFMLISTAHFIWCAKDGGLYGYIMKYWSVNTDNKGNEQKSNKTSSSPKKGGKKKGKNKGDTKKGSGSGKKRKGHTKEINGEYFLDRLFLCNFMGIVFAKSLHFQFYVWYFHTIPYLAWRSTLPLLIKWCVILGIEVIWSFVFPSNAVSSLLLWVLHLILLCAVLMFQYKENKRKLRTD